MTTLAAIDCGTNMTRLLILRGDHDVERWLPETHTSARTDFARDRAANRSRRTVAAVPGPRLHEPPGVGLALILAAPYAIGGEVLAELFVAAQSAVGVSDMLRMEFTPNGPPNMLMTPRGTSPPRWHTSSSPF